METIAHLSSWQWNRSVCPSPLAVAHTRPSRSNQPQREEEWHFKDKAKVPAQRQHSESCGIDPSWYSRYIKSEASDMVLCPHRKNTWIWEPSEGQFFLAPLYYECICAEILVWEGYDHQGLSSLRNKGLNHTFQRQATHWDLLRWQQRMMGI